MFFISHMNRKRIKNDFIYLFVRMLLFVVRNVPRRGSLFMAGLLASLLWWLLVKERNKTILNLGRAFGSYYSKKEIISVGKATFANIAQNLVDAVLTGKLLQEQPEVAMEIKGLDIAQKALDSGNGIIFLTAHLGCFEMLPARFSQLGFPLTVMGAKIYDPRLNELIITNRKSFSVDYIERGEDLRALIKLIRAGNCFGVLCDLDTKADSRFVPFFGIPAKTVVGPFRLAVRFNSHAIPIFTTRRRDGTQLVEVCSPLIPVGGTEDERIDSMMLAYNKKLEELIRVDPAQWIWMHDRWKSKP